MNHDVLAQTSQINFLHQQQQQQQQQQQPHLNNQQQPMQPQQFFCYPNNQQGMSHQNQYNHPYQPELYGINQQQQQVSPVARGGNLSQQLVPGPYSIPPPAMQSQAVGYNYSPAHILEQIRSYIGTPSPIIVFPSNCPNNGLIQPFADNPFSCPSVRVHCGAPGIHGYPAVANPCPSMLIPQYNFSANSGSNRARDCENCTNRADDHSEGQHRCTEGPNDAICTRKNCPSSINLQALGSQLLGIPGIMSCATTRLLMRKIPGSNVTTSVEETVERAKKSLGALTKDQLVSEISSAQQINALITLHMTANPPSNVVPVLTNIQLKVNSLKAHVDSLINRRESESQGVGDYAGQLNPTVLAMKTDEELRNFYTNLRQKECEERVNVNFAAYHSQRVIAETRLNSARAKIQQVEEEIDRRRGAGLRDRSHDEPRAQHFADQGCFAWYDYVGQLDKRDAKATAKKPGIYESPDPFRNVQLRNPRRLNLKPHVGSPESTYEMKKRPSQRLAKDSEEEDCDETEKITRGRKNRGEQERWNCDELSDDDSDEEAKKKLGGRNPGKGMTAIVAKSGVSIYKLSPNIVIVVEEKGNGEEIDDRSVSKVPAKETRASVKKDSEKQSSPDPERRELDVAVNETDDEKIASLTVEKTKRISWSMKNVGGKDENPEEENSNLEPRTCDNSDDTIEENFGFGPIDCPDDLQLDQTFLEDSSTPVLENKEDAETQPIREETVRLLTKIDCKPSIFRQFNDDKPVKDIIEERYKTALVGEDSSLQSASIESAVDSNCTSESGSLRVENYDNGTKRNFEMLLGRRNALVQSPSVNIDVKLDDQVVQEDRKSMDAIAEKDVSSSRTTESRENDRADRVDDSKSETICKSALTTVGNYVESFSSLMEKIISSNLDRHIENCEETTKSIMIDRKIGPKNGGSPVGNPGNSRQNEHPSGQKTIEGTSKKMDTGRWKYIRFADPPESTSTSLVGNNSTVYTLPRIKHSVIEDRSSEGGKFLVIENETGSGLNRRFGKPYKTGRSLLIRSRLKSSAGPSTSQNPGPFTVVKAPKPKDKSCLPLCLITAKALRKNAWKKERLRSSEKFWSRPEVTSFEIFDSVTVGKTINENEPEVESDDRTTCESVTATDEHILQIYDYSKATIERKDVAQLETENR